MSPFKVTEKYINAELQLPAYDDSVSLKKSGRPHERECLAQQTRKPRSRGTLRDPLLRAIGTWCWPVTYLVAILAESITRKGLVIN